MSWIEAEFARVRQRTLAVRLSLVLTLKACSRVLEDRGVLLLLFFPFGVQVLQEILGRNLLA